MQYLRELIEGNNEAVEFWEAVSKEIIDLESEIDDLVFIMDESKEKDEKIEQLEEELSSTISRDDLEVIDCGIGEIRYEEPGNMKLKTIMEELKEKLEHEAKFGTAPILSML